MHDNGASDNPRYVKLDDVLGVVKQIIDRKIENGQRALSGRRGNVAQHRFEEARVLSEEVIPALEELAS